MENRFYTLVDTVMAGSAEMACPDEETMYELETVARMCFPPYTALVSGASFSDGAIRFEYTVDDAQRSRLMEAFEAQVTALVSGAVREGDSPAMAAVALYHSYAGLVMYDYEAVQSDSVVDVTPYRAIMELTGICQSFAPAYAYLCLQCGIDAAPAGGLSESNEAHEWTLLSLDG